ncbi:MAG: methyltransferase domain-containing protein [Actinobacteria bacterium]|nr:methyltransferase domain-containing protein [Actinomycetota bacterium]
MSSLVDQREVEKLLVLAAAISSGIVDAVAGDDPRTPSEVAGVVGGSERACRVLLDALVAVGVADHVADHIAGAYRLNETGRARLIDPPPGEPVPPELERSSLLHQVSKFEGWLRLPEIVKGAAGGMGPRGPARLRSFVRTMGEGDPAVPAEVVSACLDYATATGGAPGPAEEPPGPPGEAPGPAEQAPGPADMIDVGGAVGHMARLFADRGLRATLFDRPDVLPEAREFLGKGADDIEMAAGDFTESLPAGPFDLAYLGNVFHIYGPATLQTLTRRVFEVLRPGGVIGVRDFVWERSPRAAMFAINMLQATAEGGVWREEEYRGWLTGAGFVDVRVVDLTLSTSQLILGRRPRA